MNLPLSRSLLSVLAALTAFGGAVACSSLADEPRSIGRIEHLDSGRPRPDISRPQPRPGPSSQPVETPPTTWAFGAFTASGDLALVDAASGAILSTTPAPNGSAAWRDLAWDPWRSRFVLLESTEEGRSGAIETAPEKDGTLGEVAFSAWFDGIARALPVPDGVVLFEEAYGTRWKLLFADEGISPSKIGPLPASAWVTLTADGPFVHAGVHGPETGAEIERWAGLVDGHIDTLLGYSLDLAAGTDPPCARMVRTPALDGDAVLIDLDGGEPVVRLLDGVLVGSATSLWTSDPVMRLEAAVALSGGHRIVALASDPPSLVALALAEGGDVVGAALHPLPARVRSETRFWSRDLAAVGERRVVVATVDGVFAFDVDHGAGGIAIRRVHEFEGRALRGPLAPVLPTE